MSKEHVVYVVWGEHIDEESSPSEYRFKTQGELDAFLLGVDEASGWMEAATFDSEEEALEYIEEESQ
jgi:hypothetical protein